MKTTMPLTCTYSIDEYPAMTAYVLSFGLDARIRDRDELITMGVSNFKFLVPLNTNFRLCYLGQKIKEYTTDIKANLIADIMIIYSMYYSPYYRSMSGQVTQP